MLSVSQSEGVSHISDHMNRMCLEPDFSPDEQEEKARLISQVRHEQSEAILCNLTSLRQVLELQNTLDDLTHRVDKVKEENIRLKSENSVLGQYIENLMQASQVFQAVSPKSRRSSFVFWFVCRKIISIHLQEAQASKPRDCYKMYCQGC